MELNFSQLNKVYFSISDFFAQFQYANGKKRFTMQNPRPTDAIMMFTKINSICYQEGEPPLYIPRGSLVYVPKNSRYVWEDSPAFEDNVLEKLLFEFTLNYIDVLDGSNNKSGVSLLTNERISFGEKISIIPTKHEALLKKNFEKLIVAYENKDNSLLDAYMAAYKFLNTVAETCRSNEKESKDIELINKGIQYIENNPCPQKSIKEIADMCNMSVGYFERLFKSYAKVSPKEYINFNKILHIKKMLQDTNMTLEKIAEAMNYCDSGYLCRIFKKKTGMSPKEYRRLYFASINQTK